MQSDWAQQPDFLRLIQVFLKAVCPREYWVPWDFPGDVTPRGSSLKVQSNRAQRNKIHLLALRNLGLEQLSTILYQTTLLSLRAYILQAQRGPWTPQSPWTIGSIMSSASLYHYLTAEHMVDTQYVLVFGGLEMKQACYWTFYYHKHNSSFHNWKSVTNLLLTQGRNPFYGS